MSVTESILEGLARLFGAFFGSANERELKRLWPIVGKVNEAWTPLRTLPDEALRTKTAEFRRRLLAGATEDEILPEAFAVCREASHRVLGGGRQVEARHESLQVEGGRFVYRPVAGKIPLFAHFDVQILGGIVLHQGRIAEMVTGEGKTLVATLPAYLNALRVTDAWAARAREVQGADPAAWAFRPFGLFRDEAGREQWRLLDRLLPVPGEPPPPRPERIEPVSRGVHVVTVNDYLANRDACANRPLFDYLGLEVGAIQSPMDNAERIPVYGCDITYGTNNEFGFDYLRDNLKVRREDQVQRSRHFAITDEVDSVLIDEARTPLIISGSTRQSTDKYFMADRLARQLQGEDMNAVEEKIAAAMRAGLQREDARQKAEEDADFVFSERDHTAKLTERGMHRVLRLLGTDDIYSGENLDLPHYIDNALRAHALYKRDHHYLVKDGQVFIVDEFTGRVLEGRRWSDGLHQAVEAKERLRIKEESQTVATITFQNFFKLYAKLGGMTGTAMTEAKEFSHIYRLGVTNIPTNRPLRRVNFPDLVYGTLKEKYDAIVEHVWENHRSGRPVLIGTVSIERSEILSRLLDQRGVPHEVLNAKHHAREAQIVSQAGRLGQVTVATNMAGRGTDIVLGEHPLPDLLAHWQAWGLAPKKISADLPEAELREALRRHWVGVYLEDAKEEYGALDAEAWDKRLRARWEEMGIRGPVWSPRIAEMGGLHIIGTERHEARRIDNQLRGRSGRQGDPGSSRFFLSLDDDMMRQFAPERVKQIMQWAGLKDGVPIESPMVSRSIEKAQRKVEERNFEIRKNLLEYDGVMNEQRLQVYGRRQDWLEGRNLREAAIEICSGQVAARAHEATSVHITEWDLPALAGWMKETFDLDIDLAGLEACRRTPEPDKAVSEFLSARFTEAYAAHETALGAENLRLIEMLILLETIDRRWMDHLYEMDLLRESIHLWGYAGQDPKIRYKREGFEMFGEMWDGFGAEIASLLLKVRLRGPEGEPAPAAGPAGPAGPSDAAPVPPPPAFRPKERVEVKAAIHQEFAEQAAAVDAIGAQGAERHREPIRNDAPKIGPNDPCPCKSGKKFKKCCGR